MNSTIEKFGYPDTLVATVGTWAVLLRPQQPTLGSLILVAADEVTAFSALPELAFTQLADATREIETALSAAFRYDKINYLMLMMVDPHVHFHVIPRFADEREFEGRSYTDAGWPGPPDLKTVNSTTAEDNLAIRDQVKRYWPS